MKLNILIEDTAPNKENIIRFFRIEELKTKLKKNHNISADILSSSKFIDYQTYYLYFYSNKDNLDRVLAKNQF